MNNANHKNEKKNQEAQKIKEENILSKIKNFFSDLLFPDNIKCIFCNCDIPDFEGKPYCDTCAKELSFNSGKHCKICDEPISDDAIVCTHCKDNKIYFLKAYCPFLYEGKIRQTIISFKSDNKRYMARAFAQILANYIDDKIAKFDLITFVPISKKRKKERGYNQAELIANALSKICKLPVVECLTKISDTTSQKELNFNERQKNLRNCFRVINQDLIKDKKILLVDDIITTGVTVNACAEILEKFVTSTSVCAIARTVLIKEQDKAHNKNSQ